MAPRKKATADAAEKNVTAVSAAPAADKKTARKTAKTAKVAPAAEKKEEAGKAEPKTETKKAEIKEAEIKETEIKEAEAKEVKKAPAKRIAAKKAVKSSVTVQFAGKEFSDSDLVETVKKAYAALGNKEADIKTVEIYVKPEESAAYYVINGKVSDDYKIEL